MSIVLIVAAHPDDEILGCGGTVARLVEEGNEAYSLILGEGVTSRDAERDASKRKDEIEELKKQALRANKEIGVKKVFTHDFADNRFDSIPLLDIVKLVEQVKEKVKADIIFTHNCNDLNIDHVITNKAVMTACRPMKGESVNEIYSFEILSSTEYKYPLKFSPNVFFDISKTLKKKLKAASYYKSEMREFPHPRSLKFLEINAQSWGVKTGIKYAEAFELIRKIK